MSRSDRFDRGDFAPRYADSAARLPAARVGSTSAQDASRTPKLIWPIPVAQLQRVGESVLADRDGRGRPHKGIDLFAPAGTQVLSAADGEVLRVVDGRAGASSSQRRAGLFVDVRGADALIYRYLHLGGASVREGDTVLAGAPLGTVAAAHSSGLGSVPHLHFEIAESDFERARGDYGPRRDPLRLLPPRQA